MSVRSKHLKIVGAAGAAALTVGALSAPALSAPGDLTAHVAYSCFNGAVNATGDFSVAPPSQTSLVAGQKVPSASTMTMTLPPRRHQPPAQHAGLGPASRARSTRRRRTRTSASTSRFPMTPVGAHGDDPTPARGHRQRHHRLPHRGHLHAPGRELHGDAPGLQERQEGRRPDRRLLRGTRRRLDHPQGRLGDQSTTITVVKDKSKTSTTAKYAAKTHKATGTAKVKGKKFSLPGTGKVKFVLKKGTKTVATKSGKLKKGVAKVSFKNVSKKGTYSITAKFAGDKGLKGSSGKDTFKV